MNKLNEYYTNEIYTIVRNLSYIKYVSIDTDNDTADLMLIVSFYREDKSYLLLSDVILNYKTSLIPVLGYMPAIGWNYYKEKVLNKN